MGEMLMELLVTLLVVILVVLLILVWIFRLHRNRNFMELSVSAKQPPLRLSIKTKPDHAEQLLGYLLDRIFPSVEDQPNPDEEHADSGESRDPGPMHSSATNQIIKTQHSFLQRFSQWINAARHSSQDRPKSFTVEIPHVPPTDADQSGSLPPQQADKPQQASSTCQNGSCTKDKQCDETCL